MEGPRLVTIDKKAARSSGAVATALALAILWAVSGLVTAVAFPPTAVAQFIITKTPGDVATAFIELLQHWAMRFLAIGVVVGSVVLGAQALVWASRGGRLRAEVAASVLVALSLLASIAEGGATTIVATTLVSIIAAGAYVYVARSLYEAKTASGADAGDPGRRRILAIGVGGAMGVAAAGGAIGWIARRLAGPNREVTLVPPTTPVTPPARGAFPVVPGLSPEITPVPDHYVVDIDLVKPVVEADTWTLRVFGEVDEPQEYGYDSLQSSFEVVQDYSVLTCISNEVGGPLVGHTAWGGVRLADVLEAAGPRSGVMDVVFTAHDGYTDSIPLEVAMDPAVLVAVSQDGEPLTQDHGFPCRVRIPAIYGMKNVKWLRSIELVDRDYKGYWMRRGWSDVATVRTQSRIDVAGEDGAAAVGEETWIAGVAWAGDRGVARVEVSVDGGETWSEAELKEPANEVSWSLWAYRWAPTQEGTATIVCRATDEDGEVQPSRETAPHPSGATGRHTIEVEVS